MLRTAFLDNLDEIRRIDRSNMLSFCVEAPKHYGEAAKIANAFSVSYPKPRTIVVAGMGGSAIGGELLKDWARDRVTMPIEICREYSLPAYVNRKTLVFVVSYSGETEESLSVFLDAVKRKCMVVCISSGGRLHEFAGKLNVPHLLVPSGMAPRATLPYLFMPLPSILEKIGVVSGVGVEVSDVASVLKLVSLENSPEKPQSGNFSKTLASNICGTVPVVYGFGIYRAVAQRFKTQFNENSKVPAKWEAFPELNHNEIVGWEEAGAMAKDFSLLFIRDNDEPSEMRRRIETTQKLICRKPLKAFEVWSKGKTKLAKMLSVVCIGDFTSVYLAVLRSVDPTPVRTIGLLKEKIKQSGLKDRVVTELQKMVK
jgi:glucose/mannose-6-phosphate isomerase